MGYPSLLRTEQRTISEIPECDRCDLPPNNSGWWPTVATSVGRRAGRTSSAPPLAGKSKLRRPFPKSSSWNGRPWRGSTSGRTGWPRWRADCQPAPCLSGEKEANMQNLSRFFQNLNSKFVNNFTKKFKKGGSSRIFVLFVIVCTMGWLFPLWSQLNTQVKASEVN